METPDENRGQAGLQRAVLEQGLCTDCGACVDLCPYFRHYRDATVILHPCDNAEGRCYRYCPRTPTDVDQLRKRLYDDTAVIPELGPFLGLYMTRAADDRVRAAAQHGGTVTALLALALEAGRIDAALVAGDPQDGLPATRTVQDAAGTVAAAGSKFVITPTVAAFHAAARGVHERIGVVATPCQALALAKVRSDALKGEETPVGKLQLVIGLFCGWALSWRAFTTLLQQRLGGARILSVDIPPSKHRCMEVRTAAGRMQIDMEEVLPCLRDNCRYCLDMTAEFSDLSVGSARSPEGWEVDRGWNQLIVRTARGQALLDLARERGVLEFKDVPAGHLETLRQAALTKKRTAVRNLRAKSGRPDDLLYVRCDDPALCIEME